MTYLFWGKVVRGKNRGRLLGFPTVNLRLHKPIPEGIYVSTTKFEGRIYKSVSFVGAAKTFDETEILGETFIFDFEKNIYGKWVSVRLLKKIRGNIKFSSQKELIERIKQDIKETGLFFKSPGEHRPR